MSLISSGENSATEACSYVAEKIQRACCKSNSETGSEVKGIKERKCVISKGSRSAQNGYGPVVEAQPNNPKAEYGVAYGGGG